jgi:hypothetical protein
MMRDDVRLHAALIGQQGSRARLNTPARVIDLDALEHNIAAMAAFALARAEPSPSGRFVPHTGWTWRKFERSL